MKKISLLLLAVFVGVLFFGFTFADNPEINCTENLGICSSTPIPDAYIDINSTCQSESESCYVCYPDFDRIDESCISFFDDFSDGSDIVYDNLGRISKMDYANDSRDVTYTYYWDTKNVHFVKVGNNEEVYEYDESGNLISEKYKSNSLLNRYYIYYPNGDIRQISSSDSKIIFDYYEDGILKSESVIADKKKFSTKYEYDSNYNLIKITNLNSETVYEYDSLDRLIREEILTKQEGNTYKTSEAVSYEYDGKDNLVKMIDDFSGTTVEYFYQDVTYSCVEYDELSDSFEDSECTYSELIGKKINNYEVNYTGDDDIEKYMGNTWDKEYIPFYEYDSEGYLTQFDNVHYNYGEDYSHIDSIDFLDSSKNQNNIDFEYSEDGLPVSGLYSSETGNVMEEYYYDPLGRIVKRTIEDNGESTSRGATGNVIKNIFTGNVIRNFLTGFGIFGQSDSPDVVIYYASAGDDYSQITSEEYNELTKEENLWSELTEYYSDENYMTNSCFNSDEGSNEVFINGYVEYGNKIWQDRCIDKNNVVENYCGHVLKFDFWKLEPKTFTQYCQYGCLSGKCLTKEESELFLEEEIDPTEDSDLPPEPPKI